MNRISWIEVNTWTGRTEERLIENCREWMMENCREILMVNEKYVSGRWKFRSVREAQKDVGEKRERLGERKLWSVRETQTVVGKREIRRGKTLTCKRDRKTWGEEGENYNGVEKITYIYWQNRLEKRERETKQQMKEERKRQLIIASDMNKTYTLHNT